jgi:hypothetical protein
VRADTSCIRVDPARLRGPDVFARTRRICVDTGVRSGGPNTSVWTWHGHVDIGVRLRGPAPSPSPPRSPYLASAQTRARLRGCELRPCGRADASTWTSSLPLPPSLALPRIRADQAPPPLSTLLAHSFPPPCPPSSPCGLVRTQRRRSKNKIKLKLKFIFIFFG